MSEFVLIVLAGFLAHRMEKPIENWFEDGGQNLARYTTGILLLILAFAVFAFSVFPRRIALQAIGLLCASAVGVGAGVTLAYIADGLEIDK
jgi:uncharacterized membrane protein